MLTPLPARLLPPLTPCWQQVLASPTTKDFTNIMMFLFRQFDPVLPKTFKLEEEARPALCSIASCSLCALFCPLCTVRRAGHWVQLGCSCREDAGAQPLHL